MYPPNARLNTRFDMLKIPYPEKMSREMLRLTAIFGTSPDRTQMGTALPLTTVYVTFTWQQPDLS